jgi:hypothetical protein
MTQQAKIMISTGVGVLALVVFLSIKARAGSNNPTINPTTNNDGTLPNGNTTGTCSSGEIPCPNNLAKCYNPSVNYIVNPC